MKIIERRRTNHFAIAGFLAPFISGAIFCILLLIAEDTLRTSPIFPVYLIFIPLTLLVGIVFSIKSIPLIEEKGEKDYAYAGLVLNLFFLSVYILSLIYFSSIPKAP
jgi:hypothetical protein